MAVIYYPYRVQVINSLTNWQPLSPQPAGLDGVVFEYKVFSLAVTSASAASGFGTTLTISKTDKNPDLSYFEDRIDALISSYDQQYLGCPAVYPTVDNDPAGPSADGVGELLEANSIFFPTNTVSFPGVNNAALLFTFGEGTDSFQFAATQPGDSWNAGDIDGYDASGNRIYIIPELMYPFASPKYFGNTARNYRPTHGNYCVPKIVDGEPVFQFDDSSTSRAYRLKAQTGDSGPSDSNFGYYFEFSSASAGGTATTGNRLVQAFFDKLKGQSHVLSDAVSDPFKKGGYSSGHVGGGGDFDTSSDPIPVPDLPRSDILTSGMFRLYNPTAAQLKSFADYLWSDNFVVDNIKKLFSDPMQSILGLSIIPAQAGPNVSEEVSFNGISSGVTMPRVTYQYVTVDCGSINVSEFWGAYLDYAPYTSFQLYLPYIGTRPLSVDDVMGGSLGVVYHIDVTTGACVCFVSCGNRVLYTFSGSCASEIPVTASNWSSAIGSAINIAASIGTMVATGGASAPLSVSSMASSVSNMLKPEVEKSGAMSGGAAVLGIQYPYLIITRPIQCVPEDQNNYTGYPSFVTVTLGSESGWTVVQSIHLEGVSCTAAEKDEIMQLLTTGVIIA